MAARYPRSRRTAALRGSNPTNVSAVKAADLGATVIDAAGPDVVEAVGGIVVIVDFSPATIVSVTVQHSAQDQSKSHCAG